MSTYTNDALPVVVFGSIAGDSKVNMLDVLRQAYGDLVNEIDSIGVYYRDERWFDIPATSPGQPAPPPFGYWIPTWPVLSRVLYNGSPLNSTGDEVPVPTMVSRDNFDNLEISVGTHILPTVFVDVKWATDALGEPHYQRLAITVAPDDLKTSRAYDGVPTAADVVAQAQKVAQIYADTPNGNDCHQIASVIAGTAGATLGRSTGSTNPASNQDDGFWRVVHRGSDPGASSDWEALVKPGDIVRIQWNNQKDASGNVVVGGPHTFTVTAGLNADGKHPGQIRVVDNGAGSSGNEIGEHWVDYGPRVQADNVTIHRISSDGKYLIQGTKLGDHILGTVYDDDIRGGIGPDTLQGGAGRDVLYGEDGADTLEGGDDADVLHGGGGADTLNGGTGADTMYGGANDDTYHVDNADDQVIEYASHYGGRQVILGGHDTVVASVGTKLSANVEDLVLTTWRADWGTGNELDNEITGSLAWNLLIGELGNDTLHGGGAADKLYGGFGTRGDATWFDGDDTLWGDEGDDLLVVLWGNDVVHGGADNDTLSFADVKTGLMLNLASGKTTYAEGQTYTYTNSTSTFSGVYTVTWDGIENLIGGAGKDIMTGDSLKNILMGGYGNDTLYGGGDGDTLYGGYQDLTGPDGDDTIYGDGGDDLIAVRWGNDVVHGGNDIDTLSFAGINGSVIIDLATGRGNYSNSYSYVNQNGLDSGSAYGIHTVTVDGVENVIGGAFGDTLTGNRNNNKLDGGLGSDTAVFHGNRWDYVMKQLADGSIEVRDTVAGRDGTDVLVSIEKAKFGDGTVLDFAAGNWAIVRIVGTAGNDNLNGTARAEQIEGSDGNDWLTGNGGGDTLLGGAGDDYFFVDSATVKVDGGAGADRVYADASTVAAGFKFTFLGTNVEIADGNVGNDTIDARGLTAGVAINLNSGNDIAYGGDGDDIFWAAAGNDTMYGGKGFDQMYGGDGDDVMDSGAGGLMNGIVCDRIFGEAGNDTITLQNGGWGIGGIGDDTIRGGVMSFLYGEEGNDILIGGAGYQEFHGGAGNDTMTGGADYDPFIFGDGWGADRITDFQKGVDSIDLRSVTGLDSFSQLTVKTVAGGSEVSFAGNSIVFSGVAASALTADNFLL